MIQKTHSTIDSLSKIPSSEIAWDVLTSEQVGEIESFCESLSSQISITCLFIKERFEKEQGIPWLARQLAVVDRFRAHSSVASHSSDYYLGLIKAIKHAIDQRTQIFIT